MSDGLEKVQNPAKAAVSPPDPAEQFTNLNLDAADSTRPTTPVRDRIPHPDIAGYTILGVLGQGGMGVVFKAYDQRLLRNVAIKMVAAGPIATEELLERFEREAQAVAQIQHPNIAQIYEVGEVEGRPYLVMEFVSGGTLSEHLKNKPQTPAQAAELIETLAHAVHASHEAGILHRDLKPSNVLLTRDGAAKITDFGLAKRLQADAASHATRTGDVVGTPAYMSPEQAGGVVRSIGPPTDVYSLGVILFEMLTGRPPFQTPDPLSTVLMVLSDDPVPPRRLQPSVPRDLETICLKCLEKLPSKRYATAAELADDLSRFRRREPIRARRVGMIERTLKLARRRKAAASLIIVSAILLSIITGMWIQHNVRLRYELNRTNRLFGRAHHLANWLLLEHVDAVSKLRGSTPAEKELVQQMLVYLDALANDPALVLLDEPTGDLDTATGREILGLLQKLNKEEKVTLLVATHDAAVAAICSRVVKLRDGKIESDAANAT
jgi:serine/threonine protein kinase